MFEADLSRVFCLIVLRFLHIFANISYTSVIFHCKAIEETGVPGISPPVISIPRGQIPRDLALPARPPLGISPPPPRPNDPLENIFVFRPSYQESFWNMVWQFIWQWICASQTQSQCCLIFSKVDLSLSCFFPSSVLVQLSLNCLLVTVSARSESPLHSHRIREYSFAAASLILLCLFNIAKFIDCLVGDTSLRLIYVH